MYDKRGEKLGTLLLRTIVIERDSYSSITESCLHSACTKERRLVLLFSQVQVGKDLETSYVEMECVGPEMDL